MSSDCISGVRPRTQYLHFWRDMKKKMAEDADGAGIADGPFRAWNLTNLSSAISQQAETHALLNKRQEEKKETGGVMIELDKESEALAE